MERVVKKKKRTSQAQLDAFIPEQAEYFRELKIKAKKHRWKYRNFPIEQSEG